MAAEVAHALLLLSKEHCRRPHVPSSLETLLTRGVQPELAHAARGPYGRLAIVGAGSSGG
jgi:hypothetical protein